MTAARLRCKIVWWCGRPDQLQMVCVSMLKYTSCSMALCLLFCLSSPAWAEARSEGALQSCQALTLVSTEELPKDELSAVSPAGENLASLKTIAGSIQLRIVHRTPRSEETVLLSDSGAEQRPLFSRPQIEFAPDGSWLVVIRGARLWAVASTPAKVLFSYSLEQPNRFFRDISVSNVAVAGEVWEKKPKEWLANGFREIILLDREGKTLRSHSGEAVPIAFSGKLRLSPEANRIALLNIETDRAKKKFSILVLDAEGKIVWQSETAPAYDLQWSSSGKTIFVQDARIEELQADTGKPVNKSTAKVNLVDGGVLHLDPSDEYMASFFYHYNPVTRFFDMGPEDPGWEFRLYRHGDEGPLCRVRIGRGSQVEAWPTASGDLVAVETVRGGEKPPWTVVEKRLTTYRIRAAKIR
jgi:hypothetical protein